MAGRAPTIATRRARRGLVIGPSDAGTDVNVVVTRTPPRQTSQTPRESAGEEERAAGYAHVNRWRLNDRGATANDTAARLIAAELERQPGFVSYALIRTGAMEVVAITMFETEAQLQQAMETVSPLVRRHVRPLAAAKPEHREGSVLHYRVAVTSRSWNRRYAGTSSPKG
jgi:hypothetical protein